MATNVSNGLEAHDSDRIDERDQRALEQYLTVLDDVGRAKDVPGQYLVVSQSGEQYLVDSHLPACECADFEYRSPAGGCKHIRRAAFATGERAIPAGIDQDAIDDQLGEHVDGEVHTAPDRDGCADSAGSTLAVRTDGGVATIDATTQEPTDADCDCAGLPDGVPCFECFRTEEAEFDV